MMAGARRGRRRLGADQTAAHPESVRLELNRFGVLMVIHSGKKNAFQHPLPPFDPGGGRRA